MTADENGGGFICPHCGDMIAFDLLEEAIERKQREERARQASIWDRPQRTPARYYGSSGGEDIFTTWARSTRDASPPAPVDPYDDDSPFAAVLKQPSRPAEPPPPAPAAVAPPPAAARAPAPPAAASAPRPTAAPKTAKAPAPPAAASAPGPAAARAKRPARKAAGPTVMDVLGSDKTLNAGQRETIRMIYQRFAPDVVPSADAAATAGNRTVREVLALDPNLNEGQRETIHLVIKRFSTKE